MQELTTQTQPEQSEGKGAIIRALVQLPLRLIVNWSQRAQRACPASRWIPK